MQIEEIKSIVRMMREYELTEFKIEADGCNLSISRAGSAQVANAPVVIAAPAAAAAPSANPAPASALASAPAPVEEKLDSIDSPLVGTFYRAASPEAKPFVEVGDRVTADTVVGIIEAMKIGRASCRERV